MLVMMQAEPLATPGFQPVRDRLFALAADFGRPVLLVHGDEHVYEAERRYGGIRNLTRLETFGTRRPAGSGCQSTRPLTRCLGPRAWWRRTPPSNGRAG